jgi:molybdopterin synthase sulfur carrier subunit
MIVPSADGGPITVTVHTILQLVEVMGGRDTEVELPPGSTLGSLYAALSGRMGAAPGRGVLFLPGTSTPRPDIRVMVNGRQAEFLRGPRTVLSNGDEILLLPGAAGG